MAPSLLPILTLSLSLLSSLPPPVHGEALDDLWSQYMQQTEVKKIEATVARRERNLDHWDVPTAAAYLGLHPETLMPLPRYASESSSTDNTATLSAAPDGSAITSTPTTDHLTDEYIGHDAAILFYAQWCRNCHAVAPSWDAIATLKEAGTRSSNLVMALFDCEKNTQHTELCVAAGIIAYPTIMYVGSGEYHDTDVLSSSVLGKDKSAGPYGATTLRRTVKFQGNWQYGDQLLDWVSIMKGLSSWHAVTESGPLRGLRNGIFRLITGGKYKAGKKGGSKMGKEGSLPVGVPPTFQTELRGMGSVSAGGDVGSAAAAGSAAGAVNAQEVKDLELKLNTTTEQKKLYEKAVTHSSYLLDGLLFKNSKNANADTPSRDPFTILTNSNGWYTNATTLPTTTTPNDEHPTILRSCALELSIDYCSRVTTHSLDTYMVELAAIPESDPFPTLEEIEARLMDDVKTQEPYCGLIEICMVSDFEGEECRPAKCPYENGAACDYLESCFDPKIQNEYGVALGLILEGEKVMDKDLNNGLGIDMGDEAGGAQDGVSDNAGVGGWGIPVN